MTHGCLHGRIAAILIHFNFYTLQIKASDIAFWDKNFTIMQRKHERKMYPPRVKMTVSIKDSSLTHFVLPVKFVGCKDNELDTDLTLPLGIIHSMLSQYSVIIIIIMIITIPGSVGALSLSSTSLQSRSASVGSQNSEPQSKRIICEQTQHVCIILPVNIILYVTCSEKRDHSG